MSLKLKGNIQEGGREIDTDTAGQTDKGEDAC